MNLRRRPETLLEAAEVARLATRAAPAIASGTLQAGEQNLGNYCRAPLSEGGCAAVAERELVTTMLALQGGMLKLAQDPAQHKFPMVALGQLGERGLLHRDICSPRNEKRGPFTLLPMAGVPAYPVLWSHTAARERCLVVEPDTRGEPRPGWENEAATAWQTATQLHFTLDFRINSQSLAACLTPERALGGRAWPNFRLWQTEWEKLVVLWANSTFGLLTYWWRGTRQHQGRAVLTISELPDLLVPDPRLLPEGSAVKAEAIFRDFQAQAFLPANEAWRDRTRQALDRAVLVDLWELPEEILDPLATLRHRWCCEPSVHGGKGTAPLA
ncbi:MAG: hypothetical protein OXL68_01235 [Paracoccaceae bacterium]|nr:hypothetical protein [Paracoccaceae bacterium]